MTIEEKFTALVRIKRDIIPRCNQEDQLLFIASLDHAIALFRFMLYPEQSKEANKNRG